MKSLLNVYLRSTNHDSAAGLFRVRGVGRLNVVDSHVDTLANELLAQEFTSLVHPRDVVKRTEALFLLRIGSFVFIIQSGIHDCRLNYGTNFVSNRLNTSVDGC